MKQNAVKRTKKCKECEGGRWFDPSHGCTRTCNTCRGTGRLPITPARDIHDDSEGTIQALGRFR